MPLDPIECPQCGKPTVILWSHKSDTKAPPGCHRCQSGFLIEEDDHDLAFSPQAEFIAEQWQIIPNRTVSFGDVRGYLDACFEVPDGMDIDILAEDALTLVRIFKHLEGMANDPVHFRAVTRLKRMLKELILKQRVAHARRVPWRILPPGRLGARKAAQYFRRLQRLVPELGIQEQRLEFMEKFDSDGVFVGRDSFDGYICFYFSDAKVAVLECPYYGDATYILKGDWQTLSQFSKHDLLTHFPEETTRVIHTNHFESNFRWRLYRAGVVVQNSSGP
jgi:hypothetical protein